MPVCRFVIGPGCLDCGNCVEPCPTKAITGSGKGYRIDASGCVGCGRCAVVCPSGAVSRVLSEEDFVPVGLYY
ncbi:MAG: 4Fe-4S binding protein [Firmicutes bacterium]|nr:4Fe-4S binding protein [Bacillota bacterium]